MARKNNHDVKVGVIGLVIGVILGSTLALSSSEGGSMEGLIFRRIRFDGQAERLDSTLENQLRSAARAARRL